MRLSHRLVGWAYRLSAALHKRGLVAWSLTFADDNVSRADLDKTADTIFDRLGEDVRTAARWRKGEAEILGDRLSRRYDLGMALNEAVNRVLQDRAQAKKQEQPLTGTQSAALEFQKRYLQDLINKS